MKKIFKVKAWRRAIAANIDSLLLQGMDFRSAADLVTVSDLQAMLADGLAACFLHALQDVLAAGSAFGCRSVLWTPLSTRTWFGKQELFQGRVILLAGLCAQKGSHTDVTNLLVQVWPEPLASPWKLSTVPVSEHKPSLFCSDGFQMAQSNGTGWGAVIFLEVALECLEVCLTPVCLCAHCASTSCSRIFFHKNKPFLTSKCCTDLFGCCFLCLYMFLELDLSITDYWFLNEFLTAASFSGKIS